MMIRFVLLMLATLALPAVAAERTQFVIGYLGLEDDPRHAELETYANLVLRPAVDPVDGAMTAMRDARVVGRAMKLDFSLEVARVRDPEMLTGALERLLTEAAAHFVLVDLPTSLLLPVVEQAAGRDVLLFNVSETDDALRGDHCAANLLHIIPSRSMLADALAQFVVHKGWRKVLLLQGPEPEDAVAAETHAVALRKFGARIVATRDFVAGHDPRAREKNDIQLLTTGVEYDVVLVLDSRGEFARYVPYNTVLARPVIGSTGLVASAWHWASERFGSPQLNQRFERQVDRRRRMQDAEWAAWAAVRSVLEAIMRAQSAEFADVRAALLDQQARLDLYKGVPASFRSWDHQLRQPILLHTHDAVTAYAPLPEFLHARNHLDTLGVDEPMSTCRF